jgi:uncharacterized protein
MVRALVRDERPGPVNPSDRIDSIDALRGVALLGVLAINLVMEFRVSISSGFWSLRGLQLHSTGPSRLF